MSELDDPAQIERFGVLAPLHDRKGRVNAFREQWDRQDTFRPPQHAAGYGWDGEIGEDRLGVWCTRHPEALLAQDPEVGEVLDEFFHVSERGVTRADYADRSAWWNTMWLSALCATQREERRQIRGEAEKARSRSGAPGNDREEAKAARSAQKGAR